MRIITRAMGMLVAATTAWGLTLVPAAAETASGNDEISGAIQISEFPFNDTRDHAGATVSPTDPAACFSKEHTVWYRIAIPATGTVRFAGSETYPGMRPSFAIYRGTPGALREIGCDYYDEERDFVSQHVDMRVQSGETLYLMLNGRPSDRDFRLTLVGEYLSTPVADGRLAFVRANQIYTVAPGGTGQRLLTTSGQNYRPAWSPNGKRIAYVHEEGGRKDLWVMAADGSSKRQVTLTGTVTAAPTWSPDGQFLAFGQTGQLAKIKAVAPFGQTQILLGWHTGWWGADETPADAHPISVDRYVTWHPDGSRIALFGHNDAQLDDTIDEYFLATGETRQRSATGGECCGLDEWSDVTYGPFGVLGMTDLPFDWDTGGFLPTRIVYTGFASEPHDRAPAPSPSGQRMAFTSIASGTAKVMVATSAGTNRRVVTDGYQPDWQPRP